MVSTSRVAFVATLLAAAPAVAATPEIVVQHHGRLLTENNTPASGTKALTFKLYADPRGGTDVWHDTFNVVFDTTGAYALSLGDSADGTQAVLPASLFDGKPLYLSVTVDAVELSPRLRFGSVPQAHLATRALTADNVDCEGCVLPEALAGNIPSEKLGQIGADKLPTIPVDKLPTIPGDKLDTVPLAKATGVLAVDALPSVPTTKLTGAIAASQIDNGSLPLAKLGQSSCTDGQVPKWIDAAHIWGCGNDTGSTYTAGAGISLNNGTIAVATGGLTGAMIGDGQVDLAKLGGSCASGQVIKRSGNVWACGSDDVGGGGSSGLTQVSTSAPLGGLGTSASPLTLADGGISTAKVADRAVSPAKLSLSAMPVFAKSGTRTVPGDLRIGGVAQSVNWSNIRGAFVMVTLPADGSAAPSAPVAYDIVGPAGFQAWVSAVQALANGTIVVMAGAADWELYLHGDATAQAQLRAFGLQRAAQAAAADVYPATYHGYAAAFVVGTANVAEAAVKNGVARIGGWVSDGSFVTSGDLPSALLDPVSNAVAFSSSGDGRLLVPAANTVEFGAGVTKEGNAGKIGYGTFTPDTLDIVGGGTTNLNRRAKIWTEGGLTVQGPVTSTEWLRLNGKDTVGNGLIVLGGNIYAPSADVRAGQYLLGAGSTAIGASGISGVPTVAFVNNPAGGNGDAASITFAKWGGTEDTEMLLSVGNDAADRIRLDAPGGTFTACPVGWFTFSRGHMCMETPLRPAASMDVAIQTCSAQGARVCNHADFQVACQWAGPGGAFGTPNARVSQSDPNWAPGLQGVNFYGNQPNGWYGDLGATDDTFRTWNGATCNPNNDGASVNRAAPLPYRCCF